MRDSLWPINALLLKALTQEILRRPGCRHPRHWFVLDEFPAMEKVDCIHDLLRRGRSKDASVLLGMPGKEPLDVVYGENAKTCSASAPIRRSRARAAQEPV